MKRIRFVETVIYETEGYQKGPTFEEGTTHDFEDDFADRWLRRNKAVEVTVCEPEAVEPPVVIVGEASPEIIKITLPNPAKASEARKAGQQAARKMQKPRK